MVLNPKLLYSAVSEEDGELSSQTPKSLIVLQFFTYQR